MSPNQQCQSTQEKSITLHMDLLTPSSLRGFPTLSFTTKGSWLPWGRVAMPLIPSQGNQEPLDQDLVPRFFFPELLKIAK